MFVTVVVRVPSDVSYSIPSGVLPDSPVLGLLVGEGVTAVRLALLGLRRREGVTGGLNSSGGIEGDLAERSSPPSAGTSRPSP